MLCLASGSTCDICLEPFGELKAPCSIDCGHVFCSECIQHITRPCCPLCREAYDPRYTVKLHIDTDPTKSELVRDKEARPLFERVAQIANQGTDEPTLRVLIDDCRSFLADKPRNHFEDLRVIVRLIKYLFNLKKDLRQIKRDCKLSDEKLKIISNEKEVLDQENSELKRQMQESEGIWKDKEMQLMRKVGLAQDEQIQTLKQLHSIKMDLDIAREQLRSYQAAQSSLMKERECQSQEPFGLESEKASEPSSTALFFSPLPDLGLRDQESFFHMDSQSAPFNSNIPQSETPIDDMNPSTQPFPTDYTTQRSQPTIQSPSLLSMTAPSGLRGSVQSSPFIPPESPSCNGPSFDDSEHVNPPVPYGSQPSSQCQDQMYYRPTGASHLRSRFLAIMHDSSPTMSSSMPDLTGSHFPSDMPGKEQQQDSRIPSTNSRPVTSSSRSLDSAAFPQSSSSSSSSSSHSIPLPAIRSATATVATTNGSYSQASRVAAQMEETRKKQKAQEKAHEDERRRKDSEKTKEYQDISPIHRSDSKLADDARDGDPVLEQTRRSRRQTSTSASTAAGLPVYGPHLPATPNQTSLLGTSRHDGSGTNSSRDKSQDGRSNSLRMSSRPLSSSPQQLKAAPTVGSTTPRDPPPSYKYHSLGSSKGKLATSMLSNPASVSVA